ncbi:MAG: thymidine phosphorylase [Deltaproteobacteria bacterium]|nr:thymidine phosphorylase [Deltaproteobacteria bacterium]
MRTVDFLRLVRDREPVPADEIKAFILEVTSGSIPDYQVAAFLMAACLNGLADDSTVALTHAMRDSGRIVDLQHIAGLKVDKHSTGGVGDKISLALAPLVAACGVAVPMISGRGLGHTGGTLDKLEAIPGFRVDLSIEQFTEIVSKLGLCLIGQTKDLAPADRKLYALRDVTATVESIELITASILSKKLAAGIDALVLDVKVGRGAFMKNIEQARRLAQSLVKVGTDAGLRIRALLTRMQEPLGRTIGNALEVKEAIEILQGKGPADTTELTFALGAEMLLLSGVAYSHTHAREKLTQAISSQAAIELFAKLITAQHGDARVINDPSLLPSAPLQTKVCSSTNGFINEIDAYNLAMLAMQIGAGRARSDDKIDPAVGIELLVQRSSQVQKGDDIAIIHHRHDSAIEAIANQVKQSFIIKERPPEPVALIIESIS